MCCSTNTTAIKHEEEKPAKKSVKKAAPKDAGVDMQDEIPSPSNSPAWVNGVPVGQVRS